MMLEQKLITTVSIQVITLLQRIFFSRHKVFEVALHTVSSAKLPVPTMECTSKLRSGRVWSGFMWLRIWYSCRLS
jgi:hypothetical protein